MRFARCVGRSCSARPGLEGAVSGLEAMICRRRKKAKDKTYNRDQRYRPSERVFDLNRVQTECLKEKTNPNQNTH